jgi:tetratricopeptide (TPR) repeat protein
VQVILLTPGIGARLRYRGLVSLAVVLVLASPIVAAQPAARRSEALAEKLARSPSDLRLGNELRNACRTEERVSWCIDELNALVEKNPNVVPLRYHAALAYVDYLPGHTILRQGWLSTRSIEHLDAVLELRQDDWLALYIRGLNNLYWPPFYRRTGRAIEDLQRTVELSRAAPPDKRPDYHVLGFVALGDALAKDRRPREARAIWQEALELWPGAPALAPRLATPDDELHAFVLAARDLDEPIDSDLAFLWNRR